MPPSARSPLVIADLTPQSLAAMIDHTFLKPFGTPADLEKLCREAGEHLFAMVAINPAEVTFCKRLLAGSPVRVGAAVGFPLGQNTSATKVFETADALAQGADEIDMVVNLRALQSGDEGLVRREIREMAQACRKAGAISKVILETCYLTDEQKRRVCEISVEEGADFVKTSTGMGTAGATVADVALMRSVVGDRAGVKASGGIRTLEAALAMIKAGATRIGTSHGVPIVEELRRRLRDGMKES
jgi:deoxyribose-phosphate aldolase